MTERPKSGSLLPALGILVLAAGIAAMTQQALAASIGQFVAQLFVSVMDAVMRLLGGLFGAA